MYIDYFYIQKVFKPNMDRLNVKITGQHSRPQFHLPPLGSLTDVEAPGGESGNV